MRLIDFLNPCLVKVGLESESKEELFSEMVQLFIDAELVEDRDLALQALLEREGKMSTGIARGFGLPHGKLAELDGLCIALGVSHKGIAYDSVDEEPVYVVLMAFAELDNPGPHIDMLSEVGRLISIPGFTQALQEAHTAEEALAVLASEEPPA